MSEPEYVEVAGSPLRLVRLSAPTDLGSLQQRLTASGLPTDVPVVVLVGGAGGLGASEEALCTQLFAASLVPVLEKTGAVLVDGGTDSGVMALAGRVRRAAGASGRHVGVVAELTVRWPDTAGRADAADLEPNHTDIVVVPGFHWGDEAGWLSSVTTALANGRPSVTVLANGGDIAYRDVDYSLQAGRPVLVLVGTGRTAAEIAAARAGEPADPRAVRIADDPLLETVPAEPDALTAALTSALRC
jgi:SLOG in TRPM, prokaryote